MFPDFLSEGFVHFVQTLLEGDGVYAKISSLFVWRLSRRTLHSEATSFFRWLQDMWETHFEESGGFVF